MNPGRGVLFLTEPQAADLQKQYPNYRTLIFAKENGRRLSLAQSALWEMRKSFPWVCVAARGGEGALALALAAQLPVNRIVLLGNPFAASGEKTDRESARLRTYARRNLSLVVAETVMIGMNESALRLLARGMPHAPCCALEGEISKDVFTGPWDALAEKNLLIPGKCV